MLGTQIKLGQSFLWSCAADGTSGEAEVTAVKSDREEGLSPEAEGYASLWIEAVGKKGDRTHDRFTVMLATDGLSYLDGKVIQVKVADP